MHATLQPQRGPLVAYATEPAASPATTRRTAAVTVWLSDRLEPPLAGMERAPGAR